MNTNMELRMKARVNELKYTRRFNLGNYEHEEISVGVVVGDKESPAEVLIAAMEFVQSKGAKDLEIPGNEPTSAPPLALVTDNTTAPKDAPAPAPAAEKKAKPAAVKTTPSAAAPAAAPAEKKAKVEVAAAAKPETPEPHPDPAPDLNKKFRVKGQVTKYNRNLDLHKKLVAEILDTEHQGWRANAIKARDASILLEKENVDFLDAEGKVLDSFKANLKRHMA